MLNSKSLRNILKDVFQIPDKYIVELNNSWYIPTIDLKEKVGSWIGFKVLSKKPYTRAYTTGDLDNHIVIPIKCTIRLSFVGPEAEKLADQTLLWNDRTDIIRAFEKERIQLNYEARRLYSFPVRNEGMNDMLCWVTDIDCQTTYEVDMKQPFWKEDNNG